MEKPTQASIIKIAIVGAESTGKSSLVEQLAKHYRTQFAHEFARNYFNTNNINNYTINDIEFIANKQIALEDKLMLTANQFLFCDTAMITLKIWAQNEFSTSSKIIDEAFNNQHYHLFLICNNDVPWVADNQRKHEHLREHIFKLNKHELIKHNFNYKIISGLGDDRFNNAVKIITELF